MSSASSCCFPKVPIEYDGTGRNAQFYLYTKPVQNVVLGHSDNEEMHHWVLVAEFEDESVRTLEGTQSDGKLVPVFTKEKPAIVLDSKVYKHISLETSPGTQSDGQHLPAFPQNGPRMKVYKLISVEISPTELREVALSNPLNGKDYDKLSNNCQNWVKAAAKAISSDLAKAVENYKTAGELPLHEIAAMYLSAITNSSEDLCSESCKKF
uniref:Uncharacterized protein n=1 Tax=Rhodnius prolixus TaxID=13249 RepID=A0A4P6DBM5_RHOPR